MVMQAFIRQNLSRQFLIASFPIFLLGAMLIGTWVGTRIEDSVAHRLGGVTGLYVESFIAARIQSLVHAPDLTQADREALRALLTETPLGERIVEFKIWRTDGKLLYSKNAAIIGHSFPISNGLTSALAGKIHSRIINLNARKPHAAAEHWECLVETYVPIRGNGTGKIIGVAEFYQPTDELLHESRSAQRKSWMVVASTLSVIYLLLFGLVRRGSKTIEQQEKDLRKKVSELTALNAQNEQLHDRVRRAAARTTALNESFLRRIASDLHDGPGQDLGFALMRITTIGESHATWPGIHQEPFGGVHEFEAIRLSLQSALNDLRAISAGLQLPDIGERSLAEVAARAIRDYERKTSVNVSQSTTGNPAVASLPVKITLYRLLQESLANGFRHAGRCRQHVEIAAHDNCISVEIRDDGPGFTMRSAAKEGGLGLAGMRERVEMLGGVFQVDSVIGKGTAVRIRLPLVVPGIDHG